MKTKGKLVDISHSYKSSYPNVTFQVQAEAAAVEKYFDKVLDVEFKVHRERRSLDANAMLWACIGEIAAALNSDSWSVYLLMLERYGKYTHILIKPEAVADMKAMWRETKIVGERNGMVDMLCYFGSSTYNTQEFSRLLEGVISEMKEAGLEAPMSSDMRRALDEWEEKHNNRS